MKSTLALFLICVSLIGCGEVFKNNAAEGSSVRSLENYPIGKGFNVLQSGDYKWLHGLWSRNEGSGCIGMICPASMPPVPPVLPPNYFSVNTTWDLDVSRGVFIHEERMQVGVSGSVEIPNPTYCKIYFKGHFAIYELTDADKNRYANENKPVPDFYVVYQILTKSVVNDGGNDLGCAAYKTLLDGLTAQGKLIFEIEHIDGFKLTDALGLDDPSRPFMQGPMYLPL